MSRWTFHLVSRQNDEDDDDLCAVHSLSDSAAVAVGPELYCFGGEFSGTSQMCVDVFDTASLRWKTLRPVRGKGGGSGRAAPSLEQHTAVLIYQNVYVWGGWDGDREEYSGSALYAFDVDAHRWRKTKRASGSVPPGRRGHSACAVQGDKKAASKMYVYGGYRHDEDDEDYGGDYVVMCADAIYALDVASSVWSEVTVRGDYRPPVTFSHSATAVGTRMFVFGGGNATSGYNSVRVFDTETGAWLAVVPGNRRVPSARWDHAAFAHDDGGLYVFGGVRERHNKKHLLLDLWRFDPEASTWRTVKPTGSGPKAASYASMRMRCCVVGGLAVVFGGDWTSSHLYLLELSPRLATLCKMAVVAHGLEQSTLPHNVRWELAARRRAEGVVDDLPARAKRARLLAKIA